MVLLMKHQNLVSEHAYSKVHVKYAHIAVKHNSVGINK